MTEYDNQSLSRGFKILECLGEAGEALPVAEVARRTGLHRATVHRLLTVLVGLGYVHKDAASAAYSTGFYLHTFGYTWNIIGAITRHAHRFLERLSATVGESVQLAALEGTQIVICDRVQAGDDPGAADAGLRPGARRDAHGRQPRARTDAERERDRGRRR